MTQLQKLLRWLQTYPQWGAQKLSVDYTDSLPENAGLYPGGVEELSRQADITGRVKVKNRLHFTLCRLSAGQQDSEQSSQWLLDLQTWIQQQSAEGLAPAFGDAPRQEQLRAEKGRLKSASQTGTGRYVLEISVDYIKYYEHEGE